MKENINIENLNDFNLNVIPLGDDYYTMVDGILTLGTLNELHITTPNDGYYTFEVEDDWTIQIPYNARFFVSAEEFDNNCEVAGNTRNICKTDNVSLYKIGWMMVNGEPAEVAKKIDKIIISKHKYDTEGDEELYNTRVDCLMWNDYTISENGETKTRKGYAKALQLTNEQKEKVNELETLLKEMGEMGIGMAIQNWDDKIYCYNRNDFENAYFAYEPYESDDEEMVRPYSQIIDYISTPIGSFSDDDAFFYKFK